MIGTVTQVRCRSYSSLEFDGCPSCVDAALEATEQAALYVLSRAALGQPAPMGDSIEMAYTMNVRILDEDGRTIGEDQIDAEQSIGFGGPDDAGEPGEATDPDGDDDTEAGGMRLEDFQTVLDQLDLSPLGSGMCGRISGRLYGFERSIGRFDVQVAPAR